MLSREGSVLAGLAVVGVLAAQWTALAQKPQFEVASVRENTTNGQSDLSRPRRSGDLILMHNTRIFSMVNYAYKITANYQVDGYDKFSESWKWYDIEARAPQGATDDEVRLMFQSLLADRFKFKVHHETRELPQYALVLDKGKSKLQAARDDGPMKVTIEGRSYTQDAGVCSTWLERDGAHWVCHVAKMDKITSNVGSSLRAPIVDSTGLTGTYDFHVRYIPDDRKLDPNVPPGPTFEQALREELGLRLEKGKGPVEVLVIDHLEKPSEN